MNYKEKASDFHEPNHTRITLHVRLLPTDILLGRGPTRYLHPGNRAFRDLVKSFATCYNVEACNADKMMVAKGIFLLLSRTGYRFLYQSKTNGDGGWIECTTEKAMKKIQHTLRDMRSHVIRKIEKRNSYHHVIPMPQESNQRDDSPYLKDQRARDFLYLPNQITKSNTGYSDQGESLRLLDKPQNQSDEVGSDFKSGEELSFLDDFFHFDDILQPCRLDNLSDDQSHNSSSSMRRNMSLSSFQVFLDQCLEGEFETKTV